MLVFPYYTPKFWLFVTMIVLTHMTVYSSPMANGTAATEAYIHTVHTDASSEITLGKLGRTHLLLCSFYSGTQAGLPRELRLQPPAARAFSSGTILPLSIRVMMDLRLRLNHHWSVVVRVGEACQ